MEHTKYLVAALLIGVSLASCKKEEEVPIGPPPANEEELITTLRLTFNSANGVEQKLFIFQDHDGPGGADPVITADTLSMDSTYTVSIRVLNESTDPDMDITPEIADEGVAHQFFFQPSGISIPVTYADVDANGAPIGLATVWNIGAAGSGSILITLRHGPDKSAPGVSGGDITNAGGETDIEVLFPVEVD